MTLVVEPLPGTGGETYASGDIQLRVGARFLGAEFKRKRIWRDPFVIAMRRDHPASKQKINVERYVQLPHLDVSSAIIDTRTLDDVLASKGLARRAAVTIPSLAGVIPILLHTDLCAILPEQWIRLYSNPDELQRIPLTLRHIPHARKSCCILEG